MCALLSDPTSPEDARQRRQRVLFTAFGTPVTSRGAFSLPFSIPILWAFFAWLAGRRHPARSKGWRLGVSLINAVLAQAVEWGHNLSHAAAARAVGAPMDELYVMGGTPRVVYFTNDDRVTPRQHMGRALGGPVWNALLLMLGLGLRRVTRPGSAARDIADTACGVNAFIVGAGLTPYIGLDGGPLLRWWLVTRGRTPSEALADVRAVDLGFGLGLSAGGLHLLRRREWLSGGFVALFGTLGMLLGLGLIREE